MKRLLFRLHNVLVAAEGMEDCEIKDRSYSCLWDVYRCSAGGEDYVQIDIASVKSLNDRNEWVKDRVPNNVIAEMEERLQAEVDAERARVKRLNREVA